MAILKILKILLKWQAILPINNKLNQEPVCKILSKSIQAFCCYRSQTPKTNITLFTIPLSKRILLSLLAHPIKVYLNVPSMRLLRKINSTK